MNARTYSANAELADGSRVRIRAIRPDDDYLLDEAFSRLSRHTVHQRLLYARKDLTPDELRYLTNVDFERHVALVATVTGEDGERIVGVGRYVLIDVSDGRRRAEVAFTVADDYQRRGIGSALMEHLSMIARKHHIVEFEADLFTDNRAMFRILQNSKLPVRWSVRIGVVRALISLETDVAELVR